jgi:fatty acid desaturase
MSEMTVEEYKARMMIVEKKEAKKGMVAHVIIISLVSCLLAAINLILVPGFMWFVFPLAGMWAGVVLHYVMSVLFLEKEIARRESMI